MFRIPVLANNNEWVNVRAAVRFSRHRITGQPVAFFFSKR
jgi:hypothetical protein